MQEIDQTTLEFFQAKEVHLLSYALEFYLVAGVILFYPTGDSLFILSFIHKCVTI